MPVKQLVILVLIAAYCQGDNPKSEDHVEVCLKQMRWSGDRLEYVLNNKPGRDRGCWDSCMLHQGNVMKNNKYDEEYFKKNWAIQKKLKQMEFNCMVEANKLEDPCQVALSFPKCYAEAVASIQKQTSES